MTSVTFDSKIIVRNFLVLFQSYCPKEDPMPKTVSLCVFIVCSTSPCYVAVQYIKFDILNFRGDLKADFLLHEISSYITSSKMVLASLDLFFTVKNWHPNVGQYSSYIPHIFKGLYEKFIIYRKFRTIRRTWL